LFAGFFVKDLRQIEVGKKRYIGCVSTAEAPEELMKVQSVAAIKDK